MLVFGSDRRDVPTTLSSFLSDVPLKTHIKMYYCSQTWYHLSLIPVLRWKRQVGLCEIEASMIDLQSESQKTLLSLFYYSIFAEHLDFNPLDCTA